MDILSSLGSSEVFTCLISTGQQYQHYLPSDSTDTLSFEVSLRSAHFILSLHFILVTQTDITTLIATLEDAAVATDDTN